MISVSLSVCIDSVLDSSGFIVWKNHFRSKSIIARSIHQFMLWLIVHFFCSFIFRCVYIHLGVRPHIMVPNCWNLCRKTMTITINWQPKMTKQLNNMPSRSSQTKDSLRLLILDYYGILHFVQTTVEHWTHAQTTTHTYIHTYWKTNSIYTIGHRMTLYLLTKLLN